MTWLWFNINHSVRVKFTDIWLAEFKRQREELNAKLPPDVSEVSTEPKLDEEGYYTGAMWELMCDFGYLMSVGQFPPFETEILLPADKLRQPT